ncbi:MAG: hypothetical protein WC007_13800 [Pelobacteraceae bacterium]
MRILLFTVFMVVSIVMKAPSSFAESPPAKYALGLGLEIVGGTFGTGSTSTYVTAPLVIDWFPSERLDLELTVPLLYQRSTNIGHAVLGTNAQSTAKSVARGYMNGSGSATTASGAGMSGAGGGGGGMSGGDFGLGDITLTSGYVLLQEGDVVPRVRPTVYLKFPTADESRGLGTGKFDFGGGVAVSKWLGNWQPFAEGRYIVQGGSYNETGALDFLTADAGIGYSWSENLATSAYARFGSRLFDGMSAPLEARLKVVWRFGERTYTEVYASKGFSDGSPDYGGGVSLFREF